MQAAVSAPLAELYSWALQRSAPSRPLPRRLAGPGPIEVDRQNKLDRVENLAFPGVIDGRQDQWFGGTEKDLKRLIVRSKREHMAGIAGLTPDRSLDLAVDIAGVGWEART